MTQDKARELFSTYYEGTLDAGLSQALGQNLQRDGALRSEYRAFEETYESLGALKYDSIEIPFDLHERIMSRIDRHTFETERAAPVGWTIWLRNLAIGAVATVAIVGAIISLRGGEAPVTTAGVGQLPVRAHEIVEIGLDGKDVVATLRASERSVVIFRDAETGEERRRVTLDGVESNRVRSPLTNGREEAASYLIEVVGEPTKTFVAVPGSGPSRMAEGSGTLPQFIRAAAQHFRTPVVAKVTKAAPAFAWKFEAKEPVAALAATLSTQGYSVERKIDDLVVITEH